MIRRLFLAAAALDFLALIAFLVVYVVDRAAIDTWVSTSPAFAAQARHDGVAATAAYATVAVCVVHLIVTGLFLWLAHRIRRIRATVVLVITTCVDAFVITTPVGGLTQQIVMAAAILVKVVALILLWVSPPSRWTETRSAGAARRSAE